MKEVIHIVNHRSYPLITVIVLALVAGVLLVDGRFYVGDVAIITVVIVAALLIWGLLITKQSEGMDTVRAIKQQINNGTRPTIVQFFSRYCVGCLAVKPVVDQLEAEAGDRIQIIRLDLDEEPGKTLAEEYDIVFTPSFVYFDANGNKLRDSSFILDRARILYELENA